MKSINRTVVFTGLLMLILISLRSSAQPPQEVLDKYEPHNYLYNYKSTPTELAYRLMRPIDFDATKKYPVIITLHGGTAFRLPQSPRYNIYNLQEYNEQLADDAVRTQYPAYVIAPQGKSDLFWQPEDLAGIQGIIATLPSVDLNRIYIMGTSAGGNGTHDFISAEPTYFAAAISSASNPDKIANGKRAALVNFNLWHMVGEADLDQNRYPGSVAFFDDMKSRNAKMKFTIFWKAGHSIGGSMIGSEQIFSTYKNGFKTENAGTNTDPEGDTMKWLFSKSKATNSLPVSLISFNAKIVSQGVLLDWETISETNNHSFEILRSGEDKNFQIIHNAAGAGNSNNLLKYSFLDKNPLAGNNYYQLKQTDFDGTVAVFPTIKTVKVAFNSSEFKSYFTANQFNLEINFNTQAKAIMKLFSSNGSLMFSEDVLLKDGKNSFSKSLIINPGIYISVFIVDGIYKTQKLIVQ